MVKRYQIVVREVTAGGQIDHSQEVTVRVDKATCVADALAKAALTLQGED